MDSPSPFFTQVSVFCSCNVSASPEVFWVPSEWQVHDSKAEHKNAQMRMTFIKVLKEVNPCSVEETAHFLSLFLSTPFEGDLAECGHFVLVQTCPRSSYHLSKLVMNDLSHTAGTSPATLSPKGQPQAWCRVTASCHS